MLRPMLSLNVVENDNAADTKAPEGKGDALVCGGTSAVRSEDAYLDTDHYLVFRSVGDLEIK